MAQEYSVAQQNVGTRVGMREGRVVEDAVERNSRGKSRCEQMCRFPNNGGLHRTSGNAPLETRTLRDPELITRGGMREGSVAEDAVERNSAEDAVERNSRGKSRCEQMCRFPNTGGLHRTSGNAPLETHTLQDPVPPWCHVHNSNSSSSKRTQVAAVAFKQHTGDEMVRRSTRRKRKLNENKKCRKQKLKLKDVVVGNGPLKSNVRRLTLDELRKNIVVCDGGATDSDAIKDTPGILCLRIRNRDLWVADTVKGSLGLRYRVKGGDNSPVFIRLPREESISIMKDGRSLCSAMRTCALTQGQTLTRGKKNCVFTEDGHKYCCIGAQPGRAERGVQSGLYRLKHGLPTKEWDLLHKVLKRAEFVFDRFMDTKVVRHISCARSRVNFKTMGPSPPSSNKKNARYYNGLGFGINVYLRSHIDADFTMSIVQAHIDNHDYVMDDKVICYFAFPRIGVAVALRPGDFLLFNPNEPHSISSRCNREDDVYVISSYLKTAVVGLNDNSNPIV
jgi:hypothetical protein